jgi:hypothetical protein
MSAARTRTLAALSSVDGRFALSPPSLLRQATTPQNRSLRSRFRGDPGEAIARTGRRS